MDEDDGLGEMDWIGWLPEKELYLMRDELAQYLAEWKHTAEVYADPELYARLTGPVVAPPGDATDLDADIEALVVANHADIERLRAGDLGALDRLLEACTGARITGSAGSST